MILYLFLLLTLTLQSPSLFTLYHQHPHPQSQLTVLGFSSLSPSPTSKQISHTLQLQNIPTKGIRVRFYDSDSTHLQNKYLSKEDQQKLVEKGYRIDKNNYGYNFWYEAPSAEGEILERLETQLRELVNKQLKHHPQKLRVKRSDNFLITVSLNNPKQIDYHVISSNPLLISKPSNSNYHLKPIEDRNKLLISTSKVVEAAGYYNRSLEGSGLHQTMTIQLINPTFPLSSSCKVIVEEETTDRFYLDTDQFENISSYQVINIQKPSFLSKQYYAKLQSSLKVNGTSGTFQYPIHFRYQKASTSQYMKTSITPLRNLKVKCKGKEYLLKQIQQLFLPSTNVPVGNLQDKQLVFIGTLVVTFYAAMLIKKALKGN